MKNLIQNFLILSILLISFSCDFNDSPTSRKALVSFTLVDAPGDFDEVWVEVISVRVQYVTENGEENDDESTWEEIPVEGGSQLVNLMELTGENSFLIGTESFESGRINQIRLVLGENNYVVKGEEQFELKTPSAQQSGLKLKLDQKLEAGNAYGIIIDFDVAKSIIVAGNSGNINLKPVLRAFLQETAGIQGQVLPSEAQPILMEAFQNGESFSTFTNAEGAFVIQGLEPGTYSLKITPNESYQSLELIDIVVEEGKITTTSPIILQPVE
ncbi:DUF4382 domain-containing protein [Algoriphagus kandeliae]|uniref:DUF4382 domain-containing protein n=1 Tax=Algoriphagus kandeliae TaxID=2562278 RepID=A0A4Y9QTB1_9BACT|nr:DUF4382 domain-containing protein [Algoriphagus kandeliae]TFV95781.1 DUF4382 domain-containing protein [Algoriphagus kandeliae]